MGRLADAIAQAADDGDPTALINACRHLPRRPGPRVDPRSDDDPGPIPGESFDDVTTAWIAGRISDAVYAAATAAAAASAGRLP
jgi:hypothetical protein